MGLPRTREVPRREQRAAPVSPVRSRNFDPDAARQAWRQFARGRGAHGGPALAPRINLVPWLAALAGVLALAAAWWWTRPTAEDRSQPPIVVATAPENRDANPATAGAAEVNDTPAPGASTSTSALAPPDPGVVAPSDAAVPGEPASTPMPRPIYAGLAAPANTAAPVELTAPPAPPARPQVTTPARRIPPGVSPENEKVLRKLPLSRGDADPVGGVGELGIHVDDIELGTQHARGVCNGHNRGFSLARERSINVCLRVVHARKAQQVLVLWERAGVVVRRVRVGIPATHAHRTRAGLPMRPDAAGRWRVRVMSEDGVELASRDFTVGR